MTENPDDKVKVLLNGVSASTDAAKAMKAFNMARQKVLGSSSMNMLSEQSKEWEKMMAVISGNASAAVALSSEMSRAGRVAEEVMSQYNRDISLSSKAALNMSAINAAAGAYAQLFQSPFQIEFDKISAAARQAIEVNNSVTATYRTQFEEVQKIAASMHSPWLKTRSAFESIQGIAGLSSIGKAINASTHPFEKSATNFLRDQLGDWRHMQLSGTPVLDPFQRSEFYLNQGLNPLLTDYPSSAFDEVLNVTRIRPAEVKPGISSYQRPSEVEPDIDEPPIHMVTAYKTIWAFESRIRRFIDEIMTERYGLNWVKHRVPGDIKKEWEEKRTKALDSGEPELSLICYADFTHYETVIVRKDNWEEVFKAVFRNKESITESLRRLYPMRIPTMHSRIIISDDMLYLMAETRRVLRAIEGR